MCDYADSGSIPVTCFKYVDELLRKSWTKSQREKREDSRKGNASKNRMVPTYLTGVSVKDINPCEP